MCAKLGDPKIHGGLTAEFVARTSVATATGIISENSAFVSVCVCVCWCLSVMLAQHTATYKHWDRFMRRMQARVFPFAYIQGNMPMDYKYVYIVPTILRDWAYSLSLSVSLSMYILYGKARDLHKLADATRFPPTGFRRAPDNNNCTHNSRVHTIGILPQMI